MIEENVECLVAKLQNIILRIIDRPPAGNNITLLRIYEDILCYVGSTTLPFLTAYQMSYIHERFMILLRHIVDEIW